MEKNNEYKNIDKLLIDVKLISEKYDEEASKTGERFNIFSILRLHDSEVRLHSNLISELLNPKGSHGQKDSFLKLFINILIEKVLTSENKISIEKNDFDTESAISNVEVHSGFIIDDYLEGGRLDILIKDKNKNAIIIENKIWAGDQKNQLLRYHKYGQKNLKNFYLIYLTIDGNTPSNFTTGGVLDDSQYLCLSYKSDIILWLETCLKEEKINEIVRNTIVQYINQIKIYSRQTINHNMDKEIVERLAKNITSSFHINSQMDNLRFYLMNKLKEELIIMAKDLDLMTDFGEDEFFKGNRWRTLKFYKEKWKHNCFAIKFGFEENSFGNLIYGIGITKKGENLENNFYSYLFNLKGYLHSEGLPIHQNFYINYWYNNTDIWNDIKNGVAAEKFKESIIEMTEIINSYYSK